MTSFFWPLCSGDESSIDQTTIDNCLASPPVNASNFFNGNNYFQNSISFIVSPRKLIIVWYVSFNFFYKWQISKITSSAKANITTTRRRKSVFQSISILSKLKTLTTVRSVRCLKSNPRLLSINQVLYKQYYLHLNSPILNIFFPNTTGFFVEW